MRSLIILALILTILLTATGYCAAIWPNEPAGSTLITDFRFDTKDGNGWTKVYNGGAIVQDPTAPASPSNVLQYTWRHSAGPGDVSNTNYQISGGLSEMYFGYWWKPSNPFTGWSNGLAKIILFWNDPPYSARPGKFYFGMAGPQGGPYTLGGETNYPQNNCQLNSGYGDCPGSYRIRANVKNPTIILGQWHRVEIYAKVGTCDACNNGIFRVWLDGELCYDFKNFNFPGPFTNVMLTPVWDNVEGNFPNAVDHHWFDHARISKPNGMADPFIITTETLPTGQSGKPYSATLLASGGKAPYSWTISSGSLLPGLSLNKSTGVISGVPASGGKCDFTIKALDASVPPAEAAKSFSIIASGTAAAAEAKVGTVNGKGLKFESRAGVVKFIPQQTGAYALGIYDLSGREVWRHSGVGEAVWNHGGKFKKGIYLVRAEQNGRAVSASYCNLL